MAHGIIKKVDRGLVTGGSTWHGLEEYQVVKEISIIEAEKILDYPLEKFQNFRLNENGEYIPVDSWSIVRTDSDRTLVAGVGKNFQAENNLNMLRIIDEFILAVYPELKIESVGTLWGGATAFINLKVNDFQIKGDKSPTATNLMYGNPLGRGRYVTGAHTTRIVCNNTFRIAASQAAANRTLGKFHHTVNAKKKIKNHLIDLSEVFLGLKQHQETLETLTMQDVNRAFLDDFLDKFFSLKDEKGEDLEGRGKTLRDKARSAIRHRFESDQALDKEIERSKYALFQACTGYIDHDKPSRNSDAAHVRWDSISGVRATLKNEMFEYLVN